MSDLVTVCSPPPVFSALPIARSPEPGPSVPPIEVTIGERAGEAVVRIAGQASLREANALEAGLLPLAARWPRRVTLDLSDLCSLSALALGVLTAFRRGVVRAGGEVRLGPSLQPQVREVLGAAGLWRGFESEEGSPRTEPPPR
jgi:anti-anti-sigma factor